MTPEEERDKLLKELQELELKILNKDLSGDVSLTDVFPQDVKKDALNMKDIPHGSGFIIPIEELD